MGNLYGKYGKLDLGFRFPFRKIQSLNTRASLPI